MIAVGSIVKFRVYPDIDRYVVISTDGVLVELRHRDHPTGDTIHVVVGQICLDKLPHETAVGRAVVRAHT